MKLILELDSNELQTGFVTATKVGGPGHRKGKVPIQAVIDLLGEVFNWEVAGRKVELISRLTESPLLAIGQNGPKWVAVKTIPPAEYFLVSATGKAYKVTLPRLVVLVGNHVSWPRIFWTDTDELTANTQIYPLIIGNTYNDGKVCTGTTGLKVKRPEEIDTYVRRLLESPASHTVTHGTDEQYTALETRGWDPEIGKKHGIALAKLIDQAGEMRAPGW